MTPYLTEYLDQDTFLLTATHTPKQQMTFTSSYLDLVLDFTRGDDNQGGLDGKKFAAEFTKSGVTQLTYDLFIFYDRVSTFKHYLHYVTLIERGFWMLFECRGAESTRTF